MECGSYTERDLYRNSDTGLYIVMGARGETVRDAPAYLRTNIPANVLTVQGLGDDFSAPIYGGYCYLPRPIPSDIVAHSRPQLVVSVKGFGTQGLVLYANSCAAFSDADNSITYPWPWTWRSFGDDFLWRFGTPPENVPEATICRPPFVLGWWGGAIWQAIPMYEAAAETKGGGGYLDETTTSLVGYMLPAQSKKTLVSPPVPPASLPYLRTALYSFGFWIREMTTDYKRCETVSASIESSGGNYFLKVAILWHI